MKQSCLNHHLGQLHPLLDCLVKVWALLLPFQLLSNAHSGSQQTRGKAASATRAGDLDPALGSGFLLVHSWMREHLESEPARARALTLLSLK